MADNLSQKSLKPSEKSKFNNIVHRTTSESLRLNDSEKILNQPSNLQATTHNPRKISSFQITSVTVGSRVSTDAGEDSADDLDESHTDDISRVTDFENETPSFSEDTFSKDDVFYNASSASLGCAPVIPTSSQYGLAIVGQDPNNVHGPGVPNLNHNDINDMHVSGNIINIIGNSKPQEGMKEIQEHVRNERFKVVKIESTEPFRRGRWTCMDYLDHTTTQQTAPIIVNNNLECGENANTLPAPDSGVVLTDSQHDENSVDISSKGLTKDLQISIQSDQGTGISFPIVSPGQSLTQPINLIQQNIPQTQSVSVQSPPLEMAPGQALQANQGVGQQHAQSMTHISMNAPVSHPPPTQQPPVQTIPQSFPQHQLQQVIAQSQGMPQMQQIPLHQQMPPQQIQQLQNQQIQMQSQPHLGQPQSQMQNIQQMQHMPNQQLSQMQQIQGQGQIQPQMQQLQLQHMQAQQATGSQQMHQMQQSQMPIAQHHMSNQNPGIPPQQQIQHLSNQSQLHAMQGQPPHQMTNHMQHMQMPNQQMSQISNANQAAQIATQNQMHPMSSQASGQSAHAGMHPQMTQQNLSGVQQAYIAQPVTQQTNTQPMLGTGMPPQSQPMVQQQHSVPQYHTQQSQLSQPGQSLPQDVMANIVSSQGASMQNNLQAMSSQPPTPLPTNMQMNPQQGQNMTQGSMQMISQPPQNMPMTMDNNQNNMQMPVTDPIYLQQHMQPQNILPQQVAAQGQNQQSHLPQNQLGMQYIMPQQNLNNQTSLGNQAGMMTQSNLSNIQGVSNQQGQATVQSLGQQMPQVSMSNVQQAPQPVMQNIVPQNQQPQVQQGIPQNVPQNIPMSMQQNMPVSMQGPSVHTVPSSVVQSQTNLQPQVGMPMGNAQHSYNPQATIGSMGQNVMPIISQPNISAAMGMQGSVNTQIDHLNQQNSVNNSSISQPLMTNTSSAAVSLPVNSNVNYCANQNSITSNAQDCQNFGSPVSAVVSHVVNSLVNSSVCMSSEGSAGDASAATDSLQGDMNDGREDSQAPCVDDSESASGTSAVAIDNKIEQAMDLVKSHLMFAVREEVEVLKERISELMERITQLELENAYLRSHASQDTLAQLSAAAAAPAAPAVAPSLPPAPQGGPA